MSRRTSRSQYRIRYGQPLGKDGVFVDLTVILCAISATTNITIDEITNTISAIGEITQAELTSALYTKQELITTLTDLDCNSISTQLGSVGSINSINGFEFTRAYNHNIQINSGFDFDGVKTNIIVYNRNTGGCLLNGKSQLFLQAGNGLHNITESGFKKGQNQLQQKP